MARRSYRLKQRADSQQVTRQRIVDATVELHRTVGPARTTIAAIAARAGVQRLTVYRHFPETRDLFQACGAQFVAEHPVPSLAQWAAFGAPRDQLTSALSELYGYYAETRDMRANVERDAPELPELAEAASGFARFLHAAAELLTASWAAPESQQRLLRAAVVHALSFSTWRSLVSEGKISNGEAATLMAEFVASVAGGGLR